MEVQVTAKRKWLNTLCLLHIGSCLMSYLNCMALSYKGKNIWVEIEGHYDPRRYQPCGIFTLFAVLYLTGYPILRTTELPKDNEQHEDGTVSWRSTLQDHSAT